MQPPKQPRHSDPVRPHPDNGASNQALPNGSSPAITEECPRPATIPATVSGPRAKARARRRSQGGFRAGEAEFRTRLQRKKSSRGKKPRRFSNLQLVGLIGAAIGLLLCLTTDIPGLDTSGERMLGIFIAAILLWATEAVPLYATAVGVIFAQVLFLSDQAIVPVAENAPTAATFFNSLSSPVRRTP